MGAGNKGVVIVVMFVNLALKLIAFDVGSGAVTLEVALLQAVPIGTRRSVPPVNGTNGGESPLCR